MRRPFWYDGIIKDSFKNFTIVFFSNGLRKYMERNYIYSVANVNGLIWV